MEALELREFTVSLLGEVPSVYMNILRCITISGDVMLQPAHCVGYIADPRCKIHGVNALYLFIFNAKLWKFGLHSTSAVNY